MLIQNEVETILKPNESRFEEILYNTWRDYNTEYMNVRHVHSKRTRANLLRDHAVFHANQMFSNRTNEGIQVFEKSNGLFLLEFSGEPFGIDGSVQMRIKKLNDRLLTSNIPTKNSINFNTQNTPLFKSQPNLFGEPPKVFYPSNVNLGYIPNQTWTGYSGLYVTSPNGERSIGWFMKIGDAGEDELGLGNINNNPPPNSSDNGNIIAFPMIETQVGEKPRRVTAKGVKKVKENESKS